MRLRRRDRSFTAATFEQRERFRGDYQRVAAALLELLPFASALDVGCANGFLLDAFLDAGKRVRGIELSPAVAEVLAPRLRELVDVGDFSLAGGRWDLVCCVEVAEHIPPERSRELVAKLASLAVSWIYFTAAPTGQTGRGHINCRSHLEWLDWFALEGWMLDPRSHALRQRLRQLEHVPWLVSNSALLARYPTVPAAR